MSRTAPAISVIIQPANSYGMAQLNTVVICLKDKGFLFGFN
jgi:hypothetical protein